MSVVDLGIEGYEQATEIGRGGFSVVYRAIQPAFNRHVAIKVISAVLDEQTRARVEAECVAIGGVSGHPNIVTVHETGRTNEGRPFIVMELLNSSLASILQRDGPMQWWQVADMGVKLSGALESAHRAGVLHRDIGPSNILVSRYGQPKLADFGIASVLGRAETRAGTVTDHRAHASPEELVGQGPTPASDVYSLASTLFMLVSGAPPFSRPEDDDDLAILARTPVEPVPDLRPRGVPDAFCRVLEEGMAKEPGDRPPSAGQFGRMLQMAQSRAGRPVTPIPVEGAHPRDGGDSQGTKVVPPPAPPPPTPPPPPAPAKARRWLVPACALVVVLAAVAGWQLVGGGESPTPTTTTTPPTQPTTSTLPPNLVLRDDFSSPTGWPQETDNDTSFRYVDGVYRMLIKKLNTVWRANAPAVEISGGVRAEVDAGTASTIGRVGLACRANAQGSYNAAVSNNGYWSIWKGSPTAPATTLKAAANAGEFVRGLRPTGPNRIALECLGGSSAGTPVTVTLEVNGQRVAEVQDTSGLGPGRVGLIVETSGEPVEGTFDNFVMFRKT